MSKNIGYRSLKFLNVYKLRRKRSRTNTQLQSLFARKKVGFWTALKQSQREFGLNERSRTNTQLCSHKKWRSVWVFEWNDNHSKRRLAVMSRSRWEINSYSNTFSVKFLKSSFYILHVYSNSSTSVEGYSWLLISITHWMIL